MVKEYEKPELKKYGNLKDITKGTKFKALDGSDDSK